ncbi:MAG: hypothetical protein HY795_11925 [Desulfovibrio sp.]|nr:hypothetical protein [Desulfovibrio sp.]MBI4958098.1 hypothetical protein [Desulfovibrio sp.]
MASSRKACFWAVCAFAAGFFLIFAVRIFSQEPLFVHVTGPRAIQGEHLMYLSGCIVMSHDAYYSQRLAGVNLKKAFTPRLINYVLEEEHGAPGGFTFVGNPDLNFGLHADIQVLHDVLTANSGKTLVYTTVPGALVLGIFDFEIYHARLMLDEIDAGFASLPPHTAKLRALLDEYEDSQKAVHPPATPAKDLMAEAFKAFRSARGKVAQALDSFFGFEHAVLNQFDKIDHRELVGMLRSHSNNYGAPVLTTSPVTPFLKPDELFRSKLARDIYLQFLTVFAAMAKERGNMFVLHLMPLYNLTEKDADTSYRPFFTSEIGRALSGFDNVRIVDLGEARQAFCLNDVAEAPDARRGIMYYITGKLIHARLFARAFIQEKLFPGQQMQGDLRNFFGIPFPQATCGVPPNMAPQPIAFGFFPFVATPVTWYTTVTSYWPFMRNLGVVYN